jgi:pimeloyl-ACP methyl ester carboxylesterase
MKNYRTWGKPPYAVAVVHGGPGAPGSVAPVARELSKTFGVLEPLQTKDAIAGQIEELREVLEKHATLPAILIGHSWGAWLVYLTAARHPQLAKKLVLVASGPFEEKYAVNIFPERLKRLSEVERIEVFRMIDIINGEAAGNKDISMGRLGELFTRADTFSIFPPGKEPEPLKASEEINRKVWAEAQVLRASGELLKTGRGIRCPVLAIHGDFDPHPAEGVRQPLSRVLKDFKFILLERCGHEPWSERFARDEFFRVLSDEIRTCE